ncbi:protein-disulfide reductase DsbD [Halomonas daqiaonensis]|uniref:Thiol:disulfide interchange protein DsbD n=1 Tax=Halomonas daqiaonensis TaxID=650850 RepID=A0A1H7KKZ2_9GAMM|nr:protein-disulfide reductase DsbD [Halomonas daqiaonensis]SEK87204.1 thiol:disulfide interchange protein DsbD [Halomonas daqiaonensis]
MPILLRLALLVTLLLPLGAQAQWFSQDDDEAFLPVLEAFEPSAWHDGETLHLGFEIAEGYYLYRHQFTIETAVDGLELGVPELPPGLAKSDEFLGDVNVFYDSVVFDVPLEPGHRGPLDITLTFQGCADAGLCYPPERVELTAPEGEAPAAFAGWGPSVNTDSSGSDTNGNAVTATREAVGSDVATTSGDTLSGPPQSEDGRFRTLMADASLPLVLGLFFLAGLGLTFTPCVLPMVPILSSIIVGQHPTRPRAFVLSASYVGGMALTYAAVGVLMGLFGAGLNLQARLQSAPVLITFAVLFTLFALAMFDAFNLRLSPRLAGRIDNWQARAQHSGPAGLALAGALSVLVVSPCVSAPLAGALVFISTTGDALMGGAALFALAMGMGVPLLLVGTFGTTLLPRSGAWMNGVKAAFGILLLGVAIWLVERLLPGSIALLLWAGLAIGSALALGALTVNQAQGWPRVRQAVGLMLLVWGIALVIGASRGGNDPLQPLSPVNSGAGTSSGPTANVSRAITTVEDLDALQASLVESNKPAFVNFTADWCISCKVMERDVYPAPEVASQLANFRRINVDVTDGGVTSREVLDHFQLFGPPSLLFFDGSEELRDARVQGEVNAPQLASHLEGVLDWLESRQD